VCNEDTGRCECKDAFGPLCEYTPPCLTLETKGSTGISMDYMGTYKVVLGDTTRREDAQRFYTLGNRTLSVAMRPVYHRKSTGASIFANQVGNTDTLIFHDGVKWAVARVDAVMLVQISEPFYYCAPPFPTTLSAL
jgi:hypothetical protein